VDLPQVHYFRCGHCSYRQERLVAALPFLNSRAASVMKSEKLFVLSSMGSILCVVMKKSSKHKFSLAANLTEEQKRQIEINLLKSADERKRLDALIVERDRELKAQKGRAGARNEKVAEERVRKTVGPAPALKARRGQGYAHPVRARRRGRTRRQPRR
jgi:hypothetical protein